MSGLHGQTDPFILSSFEQVIVTLHDETRDKGNSFSWLSR